MAIQGETSRFSIQQRVLLSEKQAMFLKEEVLRRKISGHVSDEPAAHGGNPNVNQAMLIREALEAHFRITNQ